ncbi:glycoside hydrolase family 32 protein [Jeotgalibacillus sp. S-D1]|uniref:glycoside hydrolase family 32 protein n=1 Tax=Jeotgalibacillus sp. S-D1 TaxID=2552189 RepID=UPI001059A543|nr:glycoside hydrolase family 32 protein [Jeotgalibacillus sp. S-D1]TDL34210.1 glycoside hydrolase family 32 protein [Jeotgalibacillus sp. S-D1]
MVINSLEKFRPKLHYAPQKNWMNDPNGLVYFEGEYHLFYQYNPYDSKWGPMHWGHAVSRDLISWEELDIALHPDDNGTIFSGSAVVDWHNTTGFFPDEPGLVAIFTHHLDKEDGNPPVQTQSLAYSYDHGRTWTKYDQNPVLKDESKIDFRDPKVFWHKEFSQWIMALATGQSISFYSSPNLIDWTFKSEFGNGIGSHDGVWECPDLFRLKSDDTGEEKWVLIVSIGDDPDRLMGSRTQYFIGSFDGGSFAPDHKSIKWLDFGKDNYAGVSFSDIPEEDGRRIYIGWMSNWRYANQVPTEGWRSQMTLPRELSLQKKGDNWQLVQLPVQELNSYFAKATQIPAGEVDGRSYYSVDESQAELTLTIEQKDAVNYGIILHHRDNQSTTITIHSAEKVLVLDRKHSGVTDFSKMFGDIQKIDLDNSSTLQLRLIVDTSSLELFIDNGAYALTSLIYPDQSCEGISVFSTEGNINVKDGVISTLSKQI